MGRLSDALNENNKRVKALENSNIRRISGIARILKEYGNIEITVEQTVNIHNPLPPNGNNFVPGGFAP